MKTYIIRLTPAERQSDGCFSYQVFDDRALKIQVYVDALDTLQGHANAFLADSAALFDTLIDQENCVLVSFTFRKVAKGERALKTQDYTITRDGVKTLINGGF